MINMYSKRIFIILIRIYQILISPLKPRTCRFHPTCSDYFIEAIQKKGIIKGFFAGIGRITRCHPFNPGGYDPVSK